MTTEGNNITLITTHVLREKDINKCILCQKEKRSEKTSSTENGRQKIKDASMKMNDSLLINLNDSEQNQIRYHSRECYKSYILKAERFHVITTNNNDTPANDTTIEDDEALPKRSKRRKSCDSDINCIICQQKKNQER